MDNKPEKVEMYKCALTGKLFTTEKAAKASAAKALKVAAKCKELEEKTAKIEQDREYKKNYLRNNLTDIRDINSMLIKLCKEYYNVDVTDLKISLMFNTNV